MPLRVCCEFGQCASEYAFPTSNDEAAWDINASLDGNLWFTEDYAVGEIVLASGATNRAKRK